MPVKANINHIWDLSDELTFKFISEEHLETMAVCCYEPQTHYLVHVVSPRLSRDEKT
jgi:hypothetical protein